MSQARGSAGASTVAVAASAALGLASIRVFMVVLYGLRESRGTTAAITAALVVFAAPIASPALERLVGHRSARGLTLVGLAIAAVTMQFMHPIPWWLAASATALALLAWTFLLHDARSPSAIGGSAFALAFLAGMVVDTTVHAAFGTWDPVWGSSWIAAIPTVVLAIAAMVMAWVTAPAGIHERRETSFARVLPVTVLGPFLVLQVLFLHDVAFVNAVAGSGLSTGVATVLTGEALACCLIVWGPRRPRAARTMAGGVVLTLLMWSLPEIGGWVAVVAVVGASGMAGLGLSLATSSGGESDRSGSWRTAVSVSFGTVVFATLVFAYQIHATSPLPYSNHFVPALAAIMLGGACLRSVAGSTPTAMDRRVVSAVVVMTVVVPLASLVMVPWPSSDPSADTSLRILSWNVHAAVDADGQLVPDVVADEISAHDPDVVVLQEVSRGWPIGGSLDLATWLSARLDMPFVWGPAADNQFGNLVLSRLPIVSSTTLALPFGAGPQQRSMLRVTLDTAGGPLTVVDTHLESAAGTDTRTRQIQVLLDATPEAPRTVIAGDMNMQPADRADVGLFLGGGFVSAQDATNHQGDSTARDPRFAGDRPDWIFASADLDIGGFDIVTADASDHQPLVVDIVL